MTFTEIVEEWLVWRSDQAASKPDKEALSAFVTHLCGRRQIPADFYLRFGALEFT